MSQFRAKCGWRVPCRWAALALSIGVILAGADARAFADGGTVRLSQTQGPYRITALTSPNPFRSGPVEINVLVQDATSGDALPDANVRLSLALRDEPDEARLFVAHSGATTNKLFHSATFQLPRAGEWTVSIDVEGPAGTARTSFDVTAGERLPRWVSFWPWFSWPFWVVALFAVHQTLARATPSAAHPLSTNNSSQRGGDGDNLGY
jgi:hypothetical protein